MLRSIIILGLLTAVPAYALTTTQEERFSKAITAIEAQTHTFYVSVDPRFGALLAPVAEDPAFRKSQRCVLARIEKDGGADMLQRYIAAMEVQGATEITSLIDLANTLPEVVTSDLVLAASSECGPMSYSTKRMMTPEFIKLMEEPAVHQRLMGK